MRSVARLAARISEFGIRRLARPHFLSHFELDPAKCASAENDRQPEQDDCDRHERRPGDVSEQDEENRDDGEDCCDVQVHSFLVVGFADATARGYLGQDS